MKMIPIGVRLRLAQHDKLVWLAQQNNITPYKMTGLVIDSGLETLTNNAALEDNIGALLAEVAALNVQQTNISNIADRILYTSCAAYAYARAASSGGTQTDEQILADIQSAYERQKHIAKGLET